VTNELSVRNVQQRRKLNTASFRRILKGYLNSLKMEYHLGIRIVAAAEMARVNEQYLKHQGCTDVITFDYGADRRTRLRPLAGDIYICVDEAFRQATVFKTSWEEELLRYGVHGILHLLGFQDDTASARRKMKQVENAVVARLAGSLPVTARRGKRRMRHG